MREGSCPPWWRVGWLAHGVGSGTAPSPWCQAEGVCDGQGVARPMENGGVACCCTMWVCLTGSLHMCMYACKCGSHPWWLVTRHRQSTRHGHSRAVSWGGRSGPALLPTVYHGLPAAHLTYPAVCCCVRLHVEARVSVYSRRTAAGIERLEVSAPTQTVQECVWYYVFACVLVP